MELTVVINEITLMASVIAAALSCFITLSVIRFRQYVFYGVLGVCGVIILAGIGASIYQIAWANPLPILMKFAMFFSILSKGNIYVTVAGFCVGVTVAVVTGFWTQYIKNVFSI